MKQFAEESLRQANEVYANAFLHSDKKEVSEAMALGVDPSTAHNYLDPESPRQLPFGLVPNSLFADELVQWLAEKCGGHFVKVDGKRNGTDRDELAKVLKEASKLAASDNLTANRKAWAAIAKVANIAMEEVDG